MRRKLLGLLAVIVTLTLLPGSAGAIESEKLRDDIVAGLALFAGPSAAAPVTYEEVRVLPLGQGHRVEIAGLVSKLGNVGQWADLGDVAFSVEETEPGHFRVHDVALPGSVPVFDGEGNRFALLAYEVTQFDGVWVGALSNFLELDLLVTDIRFALADGTFALTLGRLGGVSRAQEGDNGRTDQQASGRATGLRAEVPGEGAFDIAEITAETEVTGMDLDAYAQLTREYEAMAAREGGAGDAELAAFIERVSGLNILPAGFAQRYSISGVRASDAGGQTLFQLDGGEANLAGSGLDGASAVLRFGLKHESLEMGDGLRAQAGPMAALVPGRFGLVASVKRLPADRLWQSLLRTMGFAAIQGGLRGQPSDAMNQMLMFMMLGEALPALTQAGTQIRLPHFEVESEAAAMSAEGAFDVNPAAPQGVTGALQVAITGLDEVIALLEGEVNAGHQEAIEPLGMANWLRTLARRETDSQGRAVDRYELELTAAGQTLLNGQPFAAPGTPQ